MMRSSSGRGIRDDISSGVSELPPDIADNLSDREIELYEKLPPARQRAVLEKARQKTQRSYRSHSSEPTEDPEDGFSDGVVSRYRRNEYMGRMHDRRLQRKSGRGRRKSGDLASKREQMISLFRRQEERTEHKTKSGSNPASLAVTEPLKDAGAEKHTGKNPIGGYGSVRKEKDPGRSLFLRNFRRELKAAERSIRARDAQKREVKEQWVAEQQQREEVRYTLTAAARTAGRRISEAIEQVKKAIISGNRVKILMVAAPLGILVVLMCFLMSMVSVTTTTSDEVTYAAFGEDIVAYAKEWIGITKYILGAGRAYETDWQDYTDCSGFVHGVYSHFGYEIGGNTNAMEDMAGTVVETNSLDKALPGDVILFYTGRIGHHYSTHVGIYAGDGKMIHCSGGAANVSPETAGRGVCWGSVRNDGRQWEVRRILPEGGTAGTGTGGHRVDPTRYSKSQLELIWAVVAQEDNGSYDGALAVISCAMNRTESPNWKYLGSTAMQQLTAPGQFCYSMDHYWEPRLGGNVPSYVKQAVNDCLEKGIRNHSFTSFRSTKGKVTGPNAVQIGGNWFFGN